MTRPDLEAIRARCEAATPGPWTCKQYRSPHDGFLIQYRAHKGETETIADIPLTSDAEFIVAARTDIPALLAYVEELEADRATLLHREVMLKRAHGALTDAGCVVPIEIDRTIEHAINQLAQERDEERMRTRCFEQAMAEAQADLEDTREALHATQSKSDYWRNEFRNERLTFQSCNRARQAAEDECAELRARIAELEARR